MRNMENQDDENNQMVEEADFVIRRGRVVGFLRAQPPGSETSHSLDLLFVGNHLEWEVRVDHAPLMDIIGVLSDAECMVRRSSEKETLPWIANLSFRWPA
jgi:hypothetical protein